MQPFSVKSAIFEIMERVAVFIWNEPKSKIYQESKAGIYRGKYNFILVAVNELADGSLLGKY